MIEDTIFGWGELPAAPMWIHGRCGQISTVEAWALPVERLHEPPENYRVCPRCRGIIHIGNSKWAINPVYDR